MSEIETTDETIENTVENDSVEIESNPINEADTKAEFIPLTEEETKILQQELSDAKLKSEENWNNYLAAKAETDNIRKRSSADVEKAHKQALKKFTLELLAVKDSLEQGVKAASEESSDISKFIEGSDMTIEMFNKTFQKFGISEVKASTGDTFNPEFHQAMTMIPSPEHEPNTLIDVMQKGYVLNELLLRPAMVIVSQKTS